MKLAKIRVAIYSAVSALLLSMISLPAYASDPAIVFDDGHTDAFYIDSTNGELNVLVNHGLSNDKYDPNNVQFNIAPLAYGDYSDQMPFLTRGAIGYYTSNWDLEKYFEPGWTAPGYRENGFHSMRIDFTNVEGPGSVALLGNSFSEDDPLGTFLVPSSELSKVDDFIAQLDNEETAKAARNLYAVKGFPGGTYYIEPGVSLPIFGHTHAHWFFTAAGTYKLTGHAVGVTQDGQTVTSEPFTSTFNIIKSEKDGVAPTTPDATDGAPADDTDSTSQQTPDDSSNSADSQDTQPDSEDNPADSDDSEDSADDEDDTAIDRTEKISDKYIFKDPITLGAGHTDGFFVLTDGAKPRLVVRENLTSYEGTLRSPDSVTFHLRKEFYEKIDMNGTFKEGAGYHTNRKMRGLDQFSPGWSVDNFSSHGYKNIAVKFLSVKGPGKVVLSGTPKLDYSLNPVLSTGSPYLTEGAELPVYGHTHGLWIFTKAGNYEFTAQVIATTLDGETVTSDPVNYHWQIDAHPDDTGSSQGTDSAEPDDSQTDEPNNSGDLDGSEDSSDSDDSDEDFADLKILTSAPAIHPGDEITIKASHLPKNNSFRIFAMSKSTFAITPIADDLTSDDQGQISTTLTLPASLKPGKYFLALSKTGSEEQLANANLTVVEDTTRPLLPGDEIGSGNEDDSAPQTDQTVRNFVKTHEKVVLDHGHLDLFTAVAHEGKLLLLAKDDSTNEGILRDPADITLRIHNNALGDLPKGIDKTLPSRGYYLDAAGLSQQEILFPGWDTYGVAPTFGTTDIIINKVDGPGKVYLFNFKRQGGIEPAFTSQKYEMENGSTIRQESPSHVHTNWVFTEPGQYTMEVQARAIPTDGGEPVLSNVATYRWFVGDTDKLPDDSTDTPSPDSSGTTPPDSQPDQPKPHEAKPRLSLASGKLVGTEGEIITVQAHGLTPGTAVDFYLHSQPQLLAQNAIADIHGVASARVTIPQAPGLHEIIVTGKDGNELAVMMFEIKARYPHGVIPNAGALKPITGDDKPRIEISNGHIDLFTVLAKQGKLVVVAKDDSHGGLTHHNPHDVYWRVKNNAFTQLPDTLSDGLPSSGYFLDQAGKDQDTQLFPGWDTNGVKPDFGPTDLIFTKIVTPKDGQVFLFSNGRTGGITPTLTSNSFELNTGSIIHQEKPAHVHTNWVFSKPGIYEMEVKAVATPVNGGPQVESAPVTYTWLVGDETQPLTKVTKQQPKQNPGTEGQNGSEGNNDSTNGGTANANLANSDGTASTQGGSGTGADKPLAKCFPKQQGGNGAQTIIPQIKDDRSAPGKWVDPATLAFAVGGAGQATTNQAIGSIGSGSEVWMISATQVENVPWVGANTQNPSFLEKTKGSATLTLTSFSGPGKMEVYTSGNFGKVVGQKWFTGNGNSGSGSVTLKPNSHVHPNWVFDKPGTYKVGITMEAEAKDGKKLSGSTTLTFNVGQGSGITGGHFDLGPTVGAAGSTTVWLDADGNPCTPDANDLAAAGLAKTGVSSTVTATLLSGALMLGGIAALIYRRKVKRG